MKGKNTPIEEKKARLKELLQAFDKSLLNDERFSFVKACSWHKVNWSANACSLCSVMVDNGIIENKGKGGGYVKWDYTKKGREFSLTTLVDYLVPVIDSGANYINRYISDVNKGDIDTSNVKETDDEDDVTTVKEVREFNKNFLQKRESITLQFENNIQPVPTEKENELLNFDGVEWEIICRGLNKVITDDDPLYAKIAKRVLQKIIE